jgi:hypothetical protein
MRISSCEFRLPRTCVPQARVSFLPGIGHGLTNQTDAVLGLLLDSRLDR